MSETQCEQGCQITPEYWDTIVKVKVANTRQGSMDGELETSAGNAPAAKRKKKTQERVDTECLHSLKVRAYALAEGSPVFRTLIERWSLSKGQTRTVEVGVGANELCAFERLVDFLHRNEVPEDLTVREFVDLLYLADRFMVDSVVGHCVTGLIRLKMKWDIVLELVERLEAVVRIRSTPEIRSLLGVLNRRVLDRFTDLDLVWNSDGNRKELLDLPMPALRSLLSNPRLKVGAEETVFIVVSEWLRHTGADRAAIKSYADHHRAALELGNCVRFPLMSPSYLQVVVPSVWWIRELKPSSAWWIKEALQFQLTSDGQDIPTREHYDGHRFLPRPASQRRDCAFVVEYSVEEIRKDTTGKAYRCSEALHEGYKWSLYLFNSKGDGLKPALHISAPYGGSGSLDFLGATMSLAPKLLPKSITFQAVTRSGTRDKVIKCGSKWPIGSAHYCTGLFDARGALGTVASVTGDQSEFVVDGRIKLSARVAY